MRKPQKFITVRLANGQTSVIPEVNLRSLKVSQARLRSHPDYEKKYKIEILNDPEEAKPEAPAPEKTAGQGKAQDTAPPPPPPPPAPSGDTPGNALEAARAKVEDYPSSAKAIAARVKKEDNKLVLGLLKAQEAAREKPRATVINAIDVRTEEL